MSELKRCHTRAACSTGDELLRNRVVPARPERMTAKNSPRSEPAATDRAVLLECLDRVRRAAGHVAAARRQQRREGHLVPSDQQDEDRAHESIYCDELRRDSRRLFVDRRRDAGELVEAQPVCRWPRVDDHVDRRHSREDHRSRELAQAAFEQVPFDGRFSVLGNHEADTRVAEMRKGSAHPNVEMFGAKSLPCSRDLTQLGATCDAMTARKRGGRTRLLVRRALRGSLDAGALKRPRTCSGAAQSTASDPSCGAGRAPHGPTCRTCEGGIRES